MANVLTLTV